MVSMKISQRISWSFVLILLVFFILSSVAFSVVARRTYITEARKDLAQEANYIAENESLITRFIVGERLRLKNNALQKTLNLESKLILVSNEGEIVYADEEEAAKALLKQFRQGEQPSDLVFSRMAVKVRAFNGTIILYYRVDELKQALALNRRASVFGFLIALPFTLLLAWALQRKISKPVRHLRDRMAVYSGQKGMKEMVKQSEDEIQVLSDTFDALQHTIEENERNREILFSNISHELKTPLMTIRGYAEGIQEGVIRSDRGLETIIEETSRLNDFAQKVLALSKLSTQPLVKEGVDLKQLLEGTVMRYEPMAEQKDLKMLLAEVTSRVKLMVDEERYRQAVGNLIANAMRYAKSQIAVGGIVEAGRIGIFVEDDGDGVPEAKLETIFTRFEKGQHGQTGLGLAIVQRIMEQHGGSVKAENRESGFRITLWFPKE